MSMSDRDGFIWQDGKLVPWREATTHVLTHSLHYGMSVFEGVRAYKTERGIRVKVSSYTRHHVNISMVRAKASGHYINSILANNEVTNEGYDEAMLLDPEGYVAEGAGENLFIVKKGKLYTPDLTSCLEGITRATVLQIAGELGLSVQEKRITRDEV